MDPRTLIGLPELEAIKRIKAANFTYHVEKRDSHDSQIVNAQYISTRVKLVIRKGKVTQAIIG